MSTSKPDDMPGAGPGSRRPRTSASQQYIGLVVILWTIAVLTSLAWNLANQRSQTLEVARAQARAAYEKDIIYRRWNSQHGGVYVPVTDRTLLNEYLDVPEREIRTGSGKLLTKVNPAYMTRQAHELELERTGIRSHITSLDPIRPANAADSWEIIALREFENDVPEVSSVEPLDGESYMRLMRPLVTEQGCLKCHEEQGYRVGDVRGGLSISVPMAPLRAIAAGSMRSAAIGHGHLWLIGLLGIWLANRGIRARGRERNQAVAALRRAHAENSQLLVSIPSVLISLDAEGRVLAWNRSAESLLGHRAEEAIGRPLRELPIGWDWDELDRGIRCFRKEGRTLSLDGVAFKIDEANSGILDMTVTSLAAGGEEDSSRDEGGLLLVARDVTARRNLESQLAQAKKLESIGQLAAGIAHEINTPAQYVGDNTRFVHEALGDLMEVIASCEKVTGQDSAAKLERLAEIERSLEDADVSYLQEEIPKAIEQSLEGLERVTKIVRAMKDFSHMGSSDRQPGDINKAIESTITVARNEWKYAADLETDLDPDLPYVPCYLSDVNQVILNLIINAAQAIESASADGAGGKGRIAISTRRVEDDAEIRIADTGKGIAPEHRDRIFDPFFTTKDVGKGTGQGLSMAYATIKEKHGGEIRFETEPGRGTTFIIRLPLSPEPVEPREPVGEIP